MKLWQFVAICVVAFWVLLFGYWQVAEPAELHGYFKFGKTLETTEAVAKFELQLHSDIWRFHNELYGGTEVWMKLHNIHGEPFKDIYFIGDRIRYEPFYIEIEHYCNHPVYSSYNHEWWIENRKSKNGLTTVSIGVQW